MSKSPPTILVTPRSVTKSGHPSLRRLEAAGYELRFCTPGVQPGEEELIQLLPGCEGYLAGVERVTARVLDAADALRAISRNGTGIDNVDLQAAGRKHIQVCRAEAANARGVAELTLALVFALARSIPSSDRQIKGGGWERRLGVELAGRTLGVVGCGAIGKQVAALGRAVGMKVLACDVAPDADFARAAGIEYRPFEALLAESDVITLHVPGGPGRAPLIDSAAVGRLKPGVLLVNTARHELLDVRAVLGGLERGLISGVGLDVFEAEPPAPGELIGHDRVICTPHIGGYTAESVSRVMDVAVENLLVALGARSARREERSNA